MCTTKCMHDRVGCQKQDKFSGRAEKERVFPETNVVPRFFHPFTTSRGTLFIETVIAYLDSNR